MASRAKGDQEILYFGPGQPCGGLDYSLPYNCLAPNSLADGTVNTTQINGFVCSSPWIAIDFVQGSASVLGEYVIGTFRWSTQNVNPILATSTEIVVTNIGVYISQPQTSFVAGSTFGAPGHLLVHTWLVAEINSGYLIPGLSVSFVEVNGTVYFTGLMLNGIFSLAIGATYITPVFAQATSYVCAAYIAELGGRLIAAQCRFPGGGGTGTNVLPTVAWSGPGEYAGSGASDPWNPANGFGGGFNLLSDVPDTISGLAGMGRSAIIFRLSGLTQCDPNTGGNSGLQPFNFYHLWSSQDGVGAYPGTVAQFGYTVWFLSSDNAYSMNLYNGPGPIGAKIIPKILADLKSANYFLAVNNSTALFSSAAWMFGSIVNFSGQLHYLISLSSYTFSTGSPTQQQNTAFVYDYNISENAWHFWDMAQYATGGFLAQLNSSPIVAFSSPIIGNQVSIQGALVHAPSNIPTTLTFPFFSFGAFTAAIPSYNYGFGTISSYQLTGSLFLMVPFDYNFKSNPYNGAVSGYFLPIAIPKTTLTFRGEILSIGHRTVNRRLRVQADNAPMPSVATVPSIQVGSQQQAQATFTGSLPNNSVTSFLAWTQGAGPSQPVPYMQGNYPPQGAPMQTYYADMVLEDEMIQTSIQSFINDTTNPWNSLPAFRLSSVSLITMDPKSTTQ